MNIQKLKRPELVGQKLAYIKIDGRYWSDMCISCRESLDKSVDDFNSGEVEMLDLRICPKCRPLLKKVLRRLVIEVVADEVMEIDLG